MVIVGQLYLASTYGSGTYNSSVYNGTTTTSGGGSTPSGSGSTLTNTGFDIAAIITLALLISLAAVFIKIWKRPAAKEAGQSAKQTTGYGSGGY